MCLWVAFNWAIHLSALTRKCTPTSQCLVSSANLSVSCQLVWSLPWQSTLNKQGPITAILLENPESALKCSPTLQPRPSNNLPSVQLRKLWGKTPLSLPVQWCWLGKGEDMEKLFRPPAYGSHRVFWQRRMQPITFALLHKVSKSSSGLWGASLQEDSGEKETTVCIYPCVLPWLPGNPLALKPLFSSLLDLIDLADWLVQTQDVVNKMKGTLGAHWRKKEKQIVPFRFLCRLVFFWAVTVLLPHLFCTAPAHVQS